MLNTTFSDAELARICEQSLFYVCACPAQISMEIGKLRALYAYQSGCINGSENDVQVHQRIAAATKIAHAEMERCLDDVLQLEGWDRATLEMPANLQKRLKSAIL